jgi:hypothetical protein
MSRSRAHIEEANARMMRRLVHTNRAKGIEKEIRDALHVAMGTYNSYVGFWHVPPEDKVDECARQIGHHAGRLMSLVYDGVIVLAPEDPTNKYRGFETTLRATGARQ